MIEDLGANSPPRVGGTQDPSSADAETASQHTPNLSGTDSPCNTPPADTNTPSQGIGRYTIERELGRGRFGVVYLAWDPQLDRHIALKVPRAGRFSCQEEVQQFLEEARTATQLRHPGIVMIHDIGRDGDQVFIVQEYLRGGDLSSRLKAERLTPHRAAESLIPLAETLAYAHRQGFVHRDLKPSNVLLDEHDNLRVADFGLALHETVQRDHRGERAGTPAYMSPEQIRGETHRLDGRSDIWSLGVIFYELLTSRRPFAGASRAELYDEIRHREPKPPRQVDPSIPAELERICLKCLSKRVTERYSSGTDLAEDLRHWREHVAAGTVHLGETSARILPRGLRSFGKEDADFFLELLPGPRDRHGLPESIGFWKTRVEETVAEETFAVGLLYGPSGCGKSSLVKAGLLPRLAPHVVAVYIESRAAETEVQLLNFLRRLYPDIPFGVSLPDVFVGLREGWWTTDGRKTLVVLDQFEQWLHTEGEGTETQLLESLRHCDGGRLQCLLLVRDDFWVVTTRFMQRLEIGLHEGYNSALVDLFDPFHARKVLSRFGQAYGRLPERGFMSRDQEMFLNEAIEGLTQNGRIICVKLALLADLMKGRSWTTMNLRSMGGLEGLGRTFLEDSFSAATAPMRHRMYLKSVRAILESLLPESTAQLKGRMRSRQELITLSGCDRDVDRFDRIIEILDKETRLITPTDPENAPIADAEVLADRSATRYYQLTHDYLVPSIRSWVVAKQSYLQRFHAWCRNPDRISNAGTFTFSAGMLIAMLEGWGLLVSSTSLYKPIAQQGLWDRHLIIWWTLIFFLSGLSFLWIGSQTLMRRFAWISVGLVLWALLAFWMGAVLLSAFDFQMGGLLSDVNVRSNVLSLFLAIALTGVFLHSTAVFAWRSLKNTG